MDAFEDMIAALGDEETTVRTAYETATRAHIRAALVVEYRCRRRGCLLLHIWRSPQGLMFYQPPYKNSPRLNDATSSASGRAKNTVDGARRWRSRAGNLDRVRGWDVPMGLAVACDHVSQTVETDILLALADSARPGKETRRVL